jgi:succinate dehydrogenase / fumarate reductase membrane anchor subunit
MYKAVFGQRTALQRMERSSNFELYAWFFMRVSGMVLMFLVLFHLFYMHFVIDVEKITFQTIVDRWTGPSGAFWRMYDIFLLSFSFTHGTNGVRYVIEDYIPSQGWRVFAKTLLYITYFALLIMGAWVIFAFEG